MKLAHIPLGTERVIVSDAFRLMLDQAKGGHICITLDRDRKVIGHTQGALPLAKDLPVLFLEFCRRNSVTPINPAAPLHFDYSGLEEQNRTYEISVDELRLFANPFGIEISCNNAVPNSSLDSAPTGTDEPLDEDWEVDPPDEALKPVTRIDRVFSSNGKVPKRRSSNRAGMGGAVLAAIPDNSIPKKGKALSGSKSLANNLPQVSSHPDYDQVIGDLFDPVRVAQLERMFSAKDKTGISKWANWAEHAARNGLKDAAKVGRARFNPYRAAIWWLNHDGPEGWNLARCYRVLANNLPARSIDSKNLLIGEND